MTETLDRVKTYQQFIGGQWVDSASGQTLAVENPADGTVVAHVPASGQADVDRAVDAAEAAFETWGLTTPQTRSLALLKIADILEKRRRARPPESSQTGKPVPAAIDEMTTSSDLFRFFAGACRVPEGLAVTEYLDGHTSMVRRDPVGIVAPIAPWNYPLYMAAWKLGPALATGNTVVLKPSARSRCPPSASRSSSRSAAGGRAQRAVGLRRGDGRHARLAPQGPDGLDHGRHLDRQAHSRSSPPGPSSGSTSSWAARHP